MKINERTRTAEQWSTDNPKLDIGEMGYEIQPDGVINIKIGNGIDNWNNLPYIDEVISVNGQTGRVVIGIADIANLQTTLDSKQPNLVSGTNIKTINNQSIVGSGNIDIAGGSSAVTSVNDKTGDVVIGIADIADLQTILDGKSANDHTHTISDITDAPAASDDAPLMNATALPGTAMTWSRSDHIHPVDTGRLSSVPSVLTSSNNLDDLKSIGFYKNPSADNCIGNNYPISSAGYLHVVGDGTTGFQVFVASTSQSKYYRYRDGSGWSNWKTIWDSTNAPLIADLQGLLDDRLLLTGGVMTGPISSLREQAVEVTGTEIDLSLGNYFYKTISSNTTFTLSNIPSSGQVMPFVLELTNGGSTTIAWFSGVTWTSGSAPTLTSSGTDLIGFMSRDGGVSWRGTQISIDSK